MDFKNIKNSTQDTPTSRSNNNKKYNGPSWLDRIKSVAGGDYSRVIEDVVGYGGVQWRGDNGLCCSPLRADKHPSFSFNKRTGLYYDFSTKESGNAFTLVRDKYGLSNRDACIHLGELFGLNLGKKTGTTNDDYNAEEEIKKRKELQAAREAERAELARNEAEPGVLYPKRPPENSEVHYPPLTAGERVTQAYEYKTARGTTVCVQFRVENSDGGKRFVPVSYGKLNGVTGWHVKGLGDMRPLYNLPSIIGNPSAVVFVVEGEKSVDGLQSILSELGIDESRAVVTTSLNGSQSVNRTNWRHLMGRKVVVIPDLDTAGRGYLTNIRGMLANLSKGEQVVGEISLNRALFSEKWDAGDDFPSDDARIHFVEKIRGFLG